MNTAYYFVLSLFLTRPEDAAYFLLPVQEDAAYFLFLAQEGAVYFLRCYRCSLEGTLYVSVVSGLKHFKRVTSCKLPSLRVAENLRRVISINSTNAVMSSWSPRRQLFLDNKQKAKKELLEGLKAITALQCLMGRGKWPDESTKSFAIDICQEVSQIFKEGISFIDFNTSKSRAESVAESELSEETVTNEISSSPTTAT